MGLGEFHFQKDNFEKSTFVTNRYALYFTVFPRCFYIRNILLIVVSYRKCGVYVCVCGGGGGGGGP